MTNREQRRDRASAIFHTMQEDDPHNALPGEKPPMNDDKIDTKEHPVIALEGPVTPPAVRLPEPALLKQLSSAAKELGTAHDLGRAPKKRLPLPTRARDRQPERWSRQDHHGRQPWSGACRAPLPGARDRPRPTGQCHDWPGRECPQPRQFDLRRDPARPAHRGLHRADQPPEPLFGARHDRPCRSGDRAGPCLQSGTAPQAGNCHRAWTTSILS